MMIYCQFSEADIIITPTISSLTFRGIVIGILNGIVLFSMFDVNSAIYMAISIQAVQLIKKLYHMSKMGFTTTSLLILLSASWLVGTCLYIDISTITYLSVAIPLIAVL